MKVIFSSLTVNMTPFPITKLPLPRLEKPPTFKIEGKDSKSLDDVERIFKLNEKLRLDHITEGAEAIRAICKEYIDIFKLPGDKLTITSATTHSIPTPSVPEGRVITLKNSG